EGDAGERLARVEGLAAGDGAAEVLIAANEIRHMARAGVERALLRRAFAAALAALDDEALFCELHDPFDSVCRTLYQAWQEMPAGYADSLPPVPDWPELLTDEALRALYERRFAADTLPSVSEPRYRWDFRAGVPGPTGTEAFQRAEDHRQENFRRWAR